MDRISTWNKFKVFIFLCISSAMVVTLVFLVTGRYGSVPCGEDSWRWGLEFILLGTPLIIANFIISVIALFIKLQINKILTYSTVAQLLVTIVVFTALSWPDVFYIAPECL